MGQQLDSSGKLGAKHVILGTFIHTFKWGDQIRGDERGLVEKVKRYKARGIEFFALERNPSLQDGMGEHVYTSMRMGNCPVPPQNIRQLLVLSLYSLRAALRRYPTRPLAIYAYNQDIENLWVAHLLKVLIGSPLVIVYHQVRPAAFWSLRKGIVDRRRRGFHPISAVFRSILPALNRFVATRADVSIALSEATKEDVERHLGIKDCVVIGNGLDAAKFHPLSLPKSFDAAFLGRLAPQKGIDILLQAWSEVVRENPAFQLVLLGGGEDKDVLSYKRITRDLQLEGNVTFTGFVEDEELVRTLNSSKLFVFPSRKEGFAQAVSQAMGCGLCCVLSDIPPLKEVYDGAAVFFPVGQPNALAGEIKKLLATDQERMLFAERGLLFAAKLSWDDTVRRELAQIWKHKEVSWRPQ